MLLIPFSLDCQFYSKFMLCHAPFFWLRCVFLKIFFFVFLSLSACCFLEIHCILTQSTQISGSLIRALCLVFFFFFSASHSSVRCCTEPAVSIASIRAQAEDTDESEKIGALHHFVKKEKKKNTSRTCCSYFSHSLSFALCAWNLSWNGSAQNSNGLLIMTALLTHFVCETESLDLAFFSKDVRVPLWPQSQIKSAVSVKKDARSDVGRHIHRAMSSFSFIRSLSFPQ